MIDLIWPKNTKEYVLNSKRLLNNNLYYVYKIRTDSEQR